MYYFIINHKQYDHHDCDSEEYFFENKKEAEKAHKLASFVVDIVWGNNGDYYYEVSDLMIVEDNLSCIEDIEEITEKWLEDFKYDSEMEDYYKSSLEEIGYAHFFPEPTN